ncbi:MAG: FecR domain-containing protein [Niabella sp.]|nr:FecR domain-containing protein [Niabella sp.]
MIKEGMQSFLLDEEPGTGVYNHFYKNCQQETVQRGFRETPLLSEKEWCGLQLEEAAVPIVMPAVNDRKKETDEVPANLVAVVATVLIALAIGLLAFKNNHLSYENQSVLTSYPGTGTSLLLPDGTSVWLSAGSRLSYSPEFGNAGRQVTLEGAAFFEVADGAHPFIVHAGVLDVEGSDAAFSLRAYKSEPVTQAVLQRGRAVLQIKVNKREKVILQPNERVFIANSNGSLTEGR